MSQRTLATTSDNVLVRPSTYRYGEPNDKSRTSAACVTFKQTLTLENVAKMSLSLSISTRCLLMILALVVFTLPASAASRADVKAIQSMLNDIGYPAGSPDGLMGRKTRAAIRSYQRDEGLLQDGRPSRELRSHLERTQANRGGGAPSSQSTTATAKRATSKKSSADLLKSLRQKRKSQERTRVASKVAKSASSTAGSRSTTSRKTRQKNLSTPASGTANNRLQPRRQQAAAKQRTRGVAVATRRDSLRKVPNRRIVGHLRFNKGAQFEILTRRGLWLEVRTLDQQKESGWVRLGAVRLTDPGRVRTTAAITAPRRVNNGGVLSNALGGWLGGNSSSARSSTATIGIRGLTRSQLNASGFEDRQAMAQLDRYASANVGPSFARRGGLQARNVPYPPQQDYGSRAREDSGSGSGSSSETTGGFPTTASEGGAN
jgi:peptidoglycan hydrolase-like protein with peptidoglycan-binding domain